MIRIVIDSTLCNGCMECIKACKTRFSDHEARLSVKTDSKGRFVPLICRQCPRPTCLQGCMSGAISRDEITGHMRYDSSKCAKCYMCVMNCPYGIPFPDHNGYVARCDFCNDEGEEPRCVAACKKRAIYLEEELP